MGLEINYNDYYKFKTSLGLLMIIGSTFILIYAINSVTQQFHTFVLTSSPKVLSEQGYDSKFIEIYYTAYSNDIKTSATLIYWVSFTIYPLAMILGIYYLFSGMHQWRKKQMELDKK